MNRKIVYIIAIFLNIIFVILLYFILYYRSKTWQLLNNPVGWCSNNWVCDNVCTEQNDNYDKINDCFKNTEYTEKGLYNCLIYPDDVPCTSDDNCTCPVELNETNNCFAGCPLSLDDVGTGSTTCCCNTTNQTASSCTPCS